MERITVEYAGGQGRHGTHAVDYMLVKIGGVELYAEALPVQGDETGTYEDLRTQIIEQAKEKGIDPAKLQFQYDE